jgi:hypothetical protein
MLLLLMLLMVVMVVLVLVQWSLDKAAVLLSNAAGLIRALRLRDRSGGLIDHQVLSHWFFPLHMQVLMLVLLVLLLLLVLLMLLASGAGAASATLYAVRCTLRCTLLLLLVVLLVLLTSGSGVVLTDVGIGHSENEKGSQM